MEMELWMMDLQLPVNRTDEKKENEAAAQRMRESKLRMRKNTQQQHYAAPYSTSTQVLAAA